jgi:hypothetical protein
VTEPVLRALNLPHHRVGGPADYAKITMGFDQAHLARVPVLLLLDRFALLND